MQRNNYHRDHNELTSHPIHGDGWFYYTSEKAEERLGMLEAEQRTAYNQLKRLGLIEQANFGLPCKKYFRINVEKTREYFSKNISSSAETTNWNRGNDKLEPSKQQTEPLEKEPPIQYKRTIKKNHKKETTTRPQNAEVTPPPTAIASSASPVVVFPDFLLQLDIPDSLRQKLINENPLETIAIAAKRCLAWKDRESDTAGILTTLQRASSWKDSVSKADLSKSNTEYLKTLQHLDYRKVGDVQILVGIGYIEFTVAMHTARYETSQPNFTDEVKKKLKTLGIEA